MSIASGVLSGAYCQQCGIPLSGEPGHPVTCKECKRQNKIDDARAKRAEPDKPVAFSDIEKTHYQMAVVNDRLFITNTNGLLFSLSREELTRILPNLTRFSMSGRLTKEFPNG